MIAAAAGEGEDIAAAPEVISANPSAFSVDDVEYDLSDGDSALEYVDNYADNLSDDEGFDSHIGTALAKIRESIGAYATFWALLPALIAIILALITKEVYSSLIIGIIVGGALYAGGNFEGTLNHVIQDGFIANVADSYNIGIIIFLILLGTLVSLMNKAGGSAAFGRWATKHIKSRVGAQLATIALGVLIFVDDYFNCLTVGSVMRPVTDGHKVSRAKLSYLIDATAAPVCIIAPISSWAAAVAGFAKSAGEANGIHLFIRAIPYNFYALFTIVMMIVLAVARFDYGPMKLHEKNAVEKGDLFTRGTKQAVEEMKANEKGKVIDLVLPVIVLIICCVIGMIYSGGMFDPEADGYHSFITAFSDCDASVGLALGSAVALVISVIYFLIRRTMKFRDLMESFPEGFKAMVPAILILACAWTLKAMTDSLGAKVFISQAVNSVASGFQMLLPAIIFLVAVGLSFATGTSWGTFGILIPIVLSVFPFDNHLQIIAISACMAGAVCGDHCSPISDTTIMSSAGAQCDHINHVSTQLPYALTVAAVSFVTYVISGLLASSGLAIVALPIGAVLMVGTLIVIKSATNGKVGKKSK
ncbi:MAG: Na+/H+ antiporter NhaC family protein [Clostridia bacterium]|nr:Na+/H+ antiporter NhaC family protein [Clostridia bacterium]